MDKVPAGASNNNAKIHLLTFAGGNAFRRQAERLREEAESLGCFESITSLTDLSDHQWVREIFHEHGDFIRSQRSGFGLWVWKPVLVAKALHSIADDELLIYIDSGCEFSMRGVGRLDEYFKLALHNEAAFWSIPFLEQDWTTEFVRNKIDPDDNFSKTNQIQATWFILKKCQRTISLVNEWVRFSTQNEYELLIGKRGASSAEQNSAFIKNHRQDQSVFSLLVKQAGFRPYPWQDRFAPWLYVKGSWVLDYPIHARRCKGSGRVFKLSQTSLRNFHDQSATILEFRFLLSKCRYALLGWLRKFRRKLRGY